MLEHFSEADLLTELVNQLSSEEATQKFNAICDIFEIEPFPKEGVNIGYIARSRHNAGAYKGG